MEKREEGPSSTPAGDEEADPLLDLPSALSKLQAPTVTRLDSIIQILFSAGLIADVLPRLWARDPEECRIRQAELALLTQAALDEVRMLLLDLRLAEWADEGPAGASDHMEP